MIARYDMLYDMRTISVAVSEAVYEDFKRASREQQRPIAQLIREAMKLYRDSRLLEHEPLRRFEIIEKCKPRGPLPARGEIYDEMTGERLGS